MPFNSRTDPRDQVMAATWWSVFAHAACVKMCVMRVSKCVCQNAVL